MSKDKKQKQAQEPSQNYGPGNVLRSRREEYEWSIDAVAEALHLSTFSIKAIEADRYEDLPGSTYVIGYWRSYARLLGIDIDETIDANKRNLNIVVPESRVLDVSRSYHYDKRIGFKGWLLVLMILSAMGYYIWQQNFFGLRTNLQAINEEPLPVITNLGDKQDSSNSTLSSNESQVLRPIEKTLDKPIPLQQADQNKLDAQLAQSNDAGALSSELSLTNSAVNSTKQDLNTKSTNLLQSNNQQDLMMSSGGSISDNKNAASPSQHNDQTLTDEVASDAINTSILANLDASQSSDDATKSSSLTENTHNNEEQTTSIDDILATDESTIILNLIKDSWLDVRDKTNQRLLYKTELAGQVVKVKGSPPFYVYIGTPNGVTVQYKGKDVPFETHKSGLFARFKIGKTLESL